MPFKSFSTKELSNTVLGLQSNRRGLTDFVLLSLTHGGSKSLGGGESERLVLLFPNRVSSAYEGENFTGLYAARGDATFFACVGEDDGRSGVVGQ